MNETCRSWYDHFLRIKNGQRNPNESPLISFIKAVEKGTPAAAVNIEYNDEFAPSYSRLEAANVDTWINQSTRPFFYNDHVREVAEAAIERACDLGMPRILFGLPHSTTEIDADGHEGIMAAYHDVIKNIDEGSEDWLCVAAYWRWITACRWQNAGAPLPMILDNILVLGAICRELELAHRNKEDTLVRRRSKRVLGSQNDGRDQYNAYRRDSAIEWQRHASAIRSKLEHGHSKSAIAQNILARWETVGLEEERPPRPAKKTIQNWLSKK